MVAAGTGSPADRQDYLVGVTGLQQMQKGPAVRNAQGPLARRLWAVGAVIPGNMDAT